MSLFKKILLAVGILTAFYVGYASSAHAWPGVPDRDRWYGYFKNQRQTSGDDVMLGGIPAWVNNADTFISFIKGKLNEGTWTANGVGAAFIIQTMIGLDRSLPPQGWQIAEWEARIRYAESQGRISWFQVVNYTVNSYFQPGPVDDAFYYENGTSTAIVFRDGGGNIAYMIRRECANPVGNIAPIPDSPNYTITGRTTVSSPTARPGDTVTFSHFLRNNGPDAATTNWVSRINPGGAPINNGSAFINASQEQNVRNENYTVPANAAFYTQHCRYVSFSPAANGLGAGDGTPACVTIVPEFTAWPIVNVSTATAQQNDTVTFSYIIDNRGPTSTHPFACKVTFTNAGPGYTPLPQQDADRNPPVNPQPPFNCAVQMPVGLTTIATENVNVGNATPGSRICRSLVMNAPSQAGGIRSSAEVCVVIAKTPYVHFMGNDVWAGGGISAVNPSCNASSKISTSARNLSDGTVAGSAVEYAGFALGKITNFGSANKALSNPAALSGKTLTFSNWDSNNLGFYGSSQHCINDYVDRYSSVAVTAEPASINVGSRGSGTWHTTGAHQFSGAMPGGAQQIYLIEGDVTITGNITYPASYASITSVPSLVVIATGNITVQSGVTQLDGLFVSRGTFATCNPGPGNLSVSICNNQLIINGAVIANRLDLLRTAGADGNDDTARKRPGEVFNFNPELYLRNALSGNSGNVFRTVDQKDLPPRF